MKLRLTVFLFAIFFGLMVQPVSGTTPAPLPPPPAFAGYNNPQNWAVYPFRFDASGVPQVWREGFGWYYNPLSVAGYAHALYGAYYRGDTSSLAPMLANVQWLYANAQPANYAGYAWWTYPYPFGDSDFGTSPGWVSALADSHAMTALWLGCIVGQEQIWCQRADEMRMGFNIGDWGGGHRFLVAGNLDRNAVWLEEVHQVGVPPTHILNGHIYTVLMLRWFGQQKPDPWMASVADDGLRGLEYALHLYDRNGLSVYDLGLPGVREPAVSCNYHAIGHVPLMANLYAQTGVGLFDVYRKIWGATACP